jgi:hypothetical protein
MDRVRQTGGLRQGTILSVLGVAVVLGWVLWGGSSLAAEAGSLKILSPEPGAVIAGGEVTVTWELVSGLKESHTHIKIDDGRPMVTHKTSRTITGLKPGPHSVTIWVVDADHQPVGLEERVEFSIE